MTAGARIALCARAFGMRGIAHDPHVVPCDLPAVDAGVALTALATIGSCREKRDGE